MSVKGLGILKAFLICLIEKVDTEVRDLFCRFKN